MKKMILFIAALCVLTPKSFAQSHVDVFGEIDLTGSLFMLPTGDRGVTEFAVPGLFINLMAPLSEDNFLMIRFEGSQNKLNMVSSVNGTQTSTDTAITTQGRFNVRVREAYLDLVSLFQGLKGLRVGLIPQLWQEAQYEVWPYRFLGMTSWVMTEKWKYLSQSDLGASYMSDLPQDYGDWALTVTSGQGSQEQLKSPYKDVTALSRIRYWDDWVLSLAYSRGVYDAYGADLGVKERLDGMLSYEPSKDWTLGLEVLLSRDPSDAIKNYSMADGVDVTAGQSVRGKAASLFGILSVGMKADLMLRYDYLNAVDGQSGKAMQTAIAAWGYQMTEDIKFAFAVDYTSYGSNYRGTYRDNSKMELGAQVLF